MKSQKKTWIKRFVHKWQADFSFSTLTGSVISVWITFFFALYNGIAGTVEKRRWNMSICIYYLLLTILRIMILMAEQKLRRDYAEINHRPVITPEDQELLDALPFRKQWIEQAAGIKKQKNGKPLSVMKVFRRTHILLFSMNLLLAVPISLMVLNERPENGSLIYGIAIAAYTAYRVFFALMNFHRSQRNDKLLIRELRSIGMIDALVAALLLQDTLLAVQNAAGDMNMQILSAASSASIWLLIMGISVYSFIRGLRIGKENHYY